MGRDSKSGRASYQAIGTPAAAGNDIAVAQLAALDNDASAAGAFAQPQGMTVTRAAFVFENTEPTIAMTALVNGVHGEHEDSIRGVFDCCQDGHGSDVMVNAHFVPCHCTKGRSYATHRPR